MHKKIIPIFLFLFLVVAVFSVYLLWNNKPTQNNPAKQITNKLARPAPKYLVSLGDSVAAGDGLPISSAGSLATPCRQSDDAYPVQVAANKGLKLEQYACSGAKVTDGILDSQSVDGQSLTPQLTAATPYIKNNDVLITIGANDVNWNNELITCVLSDCETTSNQTAFQQNLDTLSTNLDTMLQQITSLHPNKVVLNTYYPLLNNSDTCLINRGISTSKVEWVNNLEGNLNTTITTAAEKYNYKTVAIDFSGHLLCDSDPWLQSLTDPAPLHPTAAGQASIAAQDTGLL